MTPIVAIIVDKVYEQLVFFQNGAANITINAGVADVTNEPV